MLHNELIWFLSLLSRSVQQDEGILSYLLWPQSISQLTLLIMGAICVFLLPKFKLSGMMELQLYIQYDRMSRCQLSHRPFTRSGNQSSSHKWTKGLAPLVLAFLVCCSSLRRFEWAKDPFKPSVVMIEWSSYMETSLIPPQVQATHNIRMWIFNI